MGDWPASEIISLIYWLGTLPGWVIASVVFAKMMVRLDDARDTVVAVLLGLCCAFMWPLFIPGYWIWEYVSSKTGNGD